MSSGSKIYDNEGYEGFTQGLTTSGRVAERIPGYGRFARLTSSICWDHLFPALKIATNENILKHNMQRYSADPQGFRGQVTKLIRKVPILKNLRPTLPEDDIWTLSATQGNFAMGGHNWRNIGVNPETTHALHLAFRAPDFLASRLGFVARAFTKLGAEERMALAVGIGSMWLLSRAANMALSDDHDPHFDEPFSIVYGKRKLTFRTVFGDMITLMKNPVGFWINRTQPVIARGLEFAFKQDAFNNAVTHMQALKDAAEEVLPIPATPRRDVKFYEGVLSAMGVHISRSSPISRVQGLAKDWTKAQGMKAPEPGIYPVSKYQQLKYAMEDKDVNSVGSEIAKLRENGESDEKIITGLKQSVYRPFTGSEKKDAEFIKSLSSEDKSKYDKAMQDRDEMWGVFEQEMKKNTLSPKAKNDLEKNKKPTSGLVAPHHELYLPVANAGNK